MEPPANAGRFTKSVLGRLTRPHSLVKGASMTGLLRRLEDVLPVVPGSEEDDEKDAAWTATTEEPGVRELLTLNTLGNTTGHSEDRSCTVGTVSPVGTP